ncbi:conserved exported hypothetical protein [Gammaproteobacteria bacterium]
MKLSVRTLFLAATVIANSAAYAGSDDAKWINQCIADNVGANVSAEVVKTYCTCMNNKMDDNENQSITQWEKKHVAEREACDKEAGWK